MKNNITMWIIGGVIVLAIILGFFLTSNPVPSTQSNTQSAASANILPREGLVEVNIENLAFSPSEIKIKAGTKITWTNLDNTIHSVTSDSGGKAELNSKLLAQGEAYGHVFDTPGVYNYHCSIHSGMKGKVVVE